ncbi:MAG: hypothetical protein EOP06_03020 [Proteobacteria bacterium]|nr:MAG: hypothetical protein EOP06_03020 [Pseudomonadota bacterium]
MSNVDIKVRVGQLASGMIENWLYSGWDNRTAADDICSDGDDGTASLYIDLYQLCSIVDDYIEESGEGYDAFFKKDSGLVSNIQMTASGAVLRNAETLAQQVAGKMESVVSDILDLSKKKKGYTVSKRSNLGMFAHHSESDVDLENGSGTIYHYRKIEGDLNVDAYEIEVAVETEWGILKETIWVEVKI